METSLIFCQLCQTTHKSCGGLAMHIIRTHKISTKEYYDNIPLYRIREKDDPKTILDIINSLNK